MLGVTVTIEFGMIGKGQANPGMPVRLSLKRVAERCPGLDLKGSGFSTGTKFYAALRARLSAGP